MITWLRAATGLAFTTPIILSLPSHAQTAPVKIPSVTTAIIIDGAIKTEDWDAAANSGTWERSGYFRIVNISMCL